MEPSPFLRVYEALVLRGINDTLLSLGSFLSRRVFVDPMGLEVSLDSRIATIRSVGLTPRLRTILAFPYAILVSALAIVLLSIVQSFGVRVWHVLEDSSCTTLCICAL
jgi:hypothetical protein